MTILITCLFSLFFILSIAAQLQNTRVQEILYSYDFAAIIPRSTLFAPTPPNLDFEILYRDRLADQQLTHWRVLSSRRTPYWGIIFWNPNKRWRKQALYICQRLVEQIHAEIRSGRPGNRLYLSFGYVMLSSYVTLQNHSVMAEYTQFMIVLNSGHDDRKAPAIVFISPFFRCDASS